MEDRAAARLALRPHPPFVQFDDAARDSQSEPRTHERRDTGRRTPIETPENRFQLRRWNSRPIVAYGEMNLGGGGRAADDDVRTLRGIAVGVGQDIDDDLLQAARITLAREGRGEVHFQCLPLLREQGRDGYGRVLDDDAQIEGLAIEAQHARLDLIEGEQIVNHHAEIFRVVPDIAQQVRLARLKPRQGARLEHAKPGPGGGERREQLVGDRRDKIGAYLIERRQSLGFGPNLTGRVMFQRKPARDDSHASPNQTEHDEAGNELANIPRG